MWMPPTGDVGKSPVPTSCAPFPASERMSSTPANATDASPLSTLSEAEAEAEERVRRAILLRQPIARDVEAEAAATASLGERLADQIARFGGSWTFILLFLAFLLFWATLNTEILGPRNKAFDPYPYIFLNLFLSMLAALQAPVIMMSQNRQSVKDRLSAANDYEVNLKAELEIRELHDKFDVLREREWARVVQLQQEQIAMLTKLLERTIEHPST